MNIMDKAKQAALIAAVKTGLGYLEKDPLLIIDEWLLYSLKETEARVLLEIVESRYKRDSMVFCSRFDITGWPEKLSDALLADVTCDQIVHDAYTILSSSHGTNI